MHISSGKILDRWYGSSYHIVNTAKVANYNVLNECSLQPWLSNTSHCCLTTNQTSLTLAWRLCRNEQHSSGAEKTSRQISFQPCYNEANSVPTDANNRLKIFKSIYIIKAWRGASFHSSFSNRDGLSCKVRLKQHYPTWHTTETQSRNKFNTIVISRLIKNIGIS